MKTIRVIVLNGIDPDRLIKDKLNSLMKFDSINHKYYYGKSKKEEVKIDILKLTNKNFNIELYKILNSFIKPSLKASAKISEEPMDFSKIESLTKVPYSVIYKYSYRDIKEVDIFDFFTDIFISFLNGHILQNGNKRFSLLFLINLTYSFGWYFKFSKGNRKNISYHKTDIEIMTKNLENLNDEIFNASNKVRINIKKWIKNNLVIDCNFV